MNAKALYRKKHRLKQRVHALGVRLSRLFRSVKLGDELHMGEVYDLAHEFVTVGRALEDVAAEANAANLAPRVFSDISLEAYKLRTYSTKLREVGEAYFGFPIRTLPSYEPGLRQEMAMKQVKSSMEALLEGLESDSDVEN